jgi:hypothetical protein
MTRGRLLRRFAAYQLRTRNPVRRISVRETDSRLLDVLLFLERIVLLNGTGARSTQRSSRIHLRAPSVTASSLDNSSTDELQGRRIN